MIKIINTFLLVIILLYGCQDDASKKKLTTDNTTQRTQPPTINGEIPVGNPLAADTTDAKSYSNTRFKDVTVERVEDNRFRIEGKAQVFEAAFSWVIEDGHNELNKGFEMTDAGAPEWGKFSFIIEAKKQRPNSTLHLILFESSAKDGSRQYELPVLLK